MRPLNTHIARSVVRNSGFDFLPHPLPLPAWSLLWASLAMLLSLSLHAQHLEAPGVNGHASPGPQTKPGSAAASYGKLPLSFEANQGQSDARVKFLSRGNGYSIFLTDSAAVLSLSKSNSAQARPRKQGIPEPAPAFKTDVVRMELAGASPGLHVTGTGQLPGTANYFIGSDPAGWHSAIPTFGKVRYSEVYPGVDLVYYGTRRQLEYDFVAAPNADVKPIRLHFAGAKTLRLDAGGNLRVIAPDGEVAFHKPLVFQEIQGQRRKVEGRFTLLGKNTIGFTLGAYDTTRALVIDPVLVYSTFLGGTLEDEANAIAVDGSGDAYVAGLTVSSDFPVTTGAFQTTNNKTSNTYTAFVTKLNPEGTALLYSTYLGGSTQDIANAIAVDGSGNAYVAGDTSSTDFPVTTGAYQTTNNTSGASTGFVTEVNPTGTALVYSTYLGGSAAEGANGIAVDGFGDAYVTGFAGSSDFPVSAGAFQTKNNATQGTAFVTELNATGTGLVYSTFLGGSFADQAYGIALDGSGSAYVAGWTGSADFPVTAGAFQTTNHDPGNSTKLLGNAFVAKLNATGTGLFYSTYLGGSVGGSAARLTTVQDQASAIAVDGSGDAYVAGFAFSTDFPVTTGAFQITNNAGSSGNNNAFLTKINSTGTALLYSTYLGGSEGNPATGITGEGAFAIAVDGSGSAYVAGTTSSHDFPVTAGAFQIANRGEYDAAFVTRLNETGTALLYSTYLGGATLDGARALALDSAGNAYLAGLSDSVDFPISPGAYQPTDKTNAFGTCFVAKLDLGFPVISTTTILTSSANPQGVGLPLTITAAVSPASGSGVPTGSVIFSVDGAAGPDIPLANGVATITPDYLLPGTFSVGTHTIVAIYSPDANGSIYGSSTGMLTQTITSSSPIATTTKLTSSANPQTAGLPVTFTVTVTPASGTYAPTGTITTTVDGATGPTLLLSNGVASITTSALAAGTHTIVATYVPDANSSDYESSSATLVQTINAATGPSISALAGSGQATTYGSAFPIPLVAMVKNASGTPVSGAVVNFSGPGLSFSSTSATTGSNGEASVTATATATGSLTATASTSGVTPSAGFALIATPAILTVTANNASRIFGALNPTFTDAITGFVNGDTQSVVSGAAALSTTATTSSPVGDYPITAGPGTLSAANYTFSFVNGTLTVTADTMPPTLVVTTAADDNPGVAANCTAQAAAGTGTDPACSLRDALVYAGNAGSATISFDGTAFSAANSVAHNTITLGSGGTLNIPSNTTISGRYSTGSGKLVANLVAVSGAGSYSVFNVASGMAAIDGLTIFNGSIPSGSGGGIINDGTLTLTNSTLSGNTSALGGGIFNSGTLTIANATLAGNSSSTTGGAIYSSGKLTVSDSTISANSASSAGGGIENSTGLLQLANSIVSGNAAASSADIAGSYTNNGGNLVSGNANLTPLGNSGGPTQTLVPLPGSSAICAGTLANATAAGFSTDQRGFAFDPNCPAGSVDVGAVQTNYAMGFAPLPSDVPLGQAITPAPTVTLYESGTAASAATGSVTLSDTGATLSGTTTEDLSSGIATFPNVSFTTLGLNTQVMATMALTSTLNLTANAGSTVTSSPMTASLTSPAPDSTLPGPTVAFSWNAVSGATGYSLWIGTTGVGSHNIYDSGAKTVTSIKVGNLPTNGQAVYVRLYTIYNGVAQPNDYVFAASRLAALTSPVPGSTLTGSTVTFGWSAAAGASAYSLWLGSTGVGSHNLYDSGEITGTSATVDTLPTNGTTIYARIFTNYNGVTVSTDSVYIATNLPLAMLASPTPGSALSGPTVTFTWSAATGATGYSLWLGSSQGANDLYNSHLTTGLSAIAHNLPTNGEIIYARLYTNYNGKVKYLDYTYTAHE